MRTKKAKKIVASVLAAFMICAALLSVLPLLVNAAEEETLSYPISGYNPGEDCYDPIPMLVIMINFDADGDVDSNDAIYLLYYTQLGEENYPLSQSGDVNGDGYVNSDDAVYLVYYTFFGSYEYPLYN